MTWRSLLSLVGILVGMGCGNTRQPEAKNLILAHRQEAEGYFRSNLKPLNSRVTGSIKGKGSFFIKDIQFYASVVFHSGWPKVSHLQMIHAGSQCPTSRDDLNNDGLIDWEELVLVSGLPLIPLDGDLSGQLKKFTKIPSTNSKGRYFYSASTRLSLILAELSSRRTNDSSFLGRIGENEKLKLIERTVVIYGVPHHKRLPLLPTFAGFPVNMSLPIACGTISETLETFP